MTNRSQCVRWNRTQSDAFGFSIGVPQGSIIGPLFLIQYVNDYQDWLQSSSAHMYGDDNVSD